MTDENTLTAIEALKQANDAPSISMPWVKQLSEHVNDICNRFIEIGQLLLSVENEYGREHIKDELTRSGAPLNDSTASRLITLAKNEKVIALAARQMAPSSYRSLYELARLPDEEIDNGIESGFIHVNMTSREAAALYQSWKNRLEPERDGSNAKGKAKRRAIQEQIRINSIWQNCVAWACTITQFDMGQKTLDRKSVLSLHTAQIAMYLAHTEGTIPYNKIAHKAAEVAGCKKPTVIRAVHTVAWARDASPDLDKMLDEAANSIHAMSAMNAEIERIGALDVQCGIDAMAEHAESERLWNEDRYEDIKISA